MAQEHDEVDETKTTSKVESIWLYVGVSVQSHGFQLSFPHFETEYNSSKDLYISLLPITRPDLKYQQEKNASYRFKKKSISR